jgi:hypothetical protein
MNLQITLYCFRMIQAPFAWKYGHDRGTLRHVTVTCDFLKRLCAANSLDSPPSDRKRCAACCFKTSASVAACRSPWRRSSRGTRIKYWVQTVSLRIYALIWRCNHELDKRKKICSFFVLSEFCPARSSQVVHDPESEAGKRQYCRCSSMALIACLTLSFNGL